ncbi:signal peptidase II [Marinicella gelatinilytica]|uniref:signal peptidase II n=1 Tax=Marinicella gelatinilytica TaxID=2996017 RepID=UPI002260A064|nr:signal peptidase II [Marinicella gelatinilytica]MCX7544587.1 signal peptidase II [Marinicella gelatinilytica]
MQLRERGLVWLWLSVVVLIADQITKFWASQTLTLYVPEKVTGFFNLTLLHNKGIAFSLLADQPGWQRWFILIMASVIVVWLLVWLFNSPRKLKLHNISLALVIGGALGNIYDRAVLGYVVDFIQLHYNDYYWPAFNIADSAISVGAVLLIIDTLFSKQDKQQNESTSG